MEVSFHFVLSFFPRFPNLCRVFRLVVAASRSRAPCLLFLHYAIRLRRARRVSRYTRRTMPSLAHIHGDHQARTHLPCLACTVRLAAAVSRSLDTIDKWLHVSLCRGIPGRRSRRDYPRSREQHPCAWLGTWRQSGHLPWQRPWRARLQDNMGLQAGSRGDAPSRRSHHPGQGGLDIGHLAGEPSTRRLASFRAVCLDSHSRDGSRQLLRPRFYFDVLAIRRVRASVARRRLVCSLGARGGFVSCKTAICISCVQIQVFRFLLQVWRRLLPPVTHSQPCNEVVVSHSFASIPSFVGENLQCHFPAMLETRDLNSRLSFSILLHNTLHSLIVFYASRFYGEYAICARRFCLLRLRSLITSPFPSCGRETLCFFSAF